MERPVMINVRMTVLMCTGRMTAGEQDAGSGSFGIRGSDGGSTRGAPPTKPISLTVWSIVLLPLAVIIAMHTRSDTVIIRKTGDGTKHSTLRAVGFSLVKR